MDVLLHSLPPILQQATTDPCFCWRFLDTPGQVWICLLWGHCSFLLGPGAHKVLFVPSKSLFPSPVYVLAALGRINGDLLQEGLCQPQVCCTQSPCPCGRPLLTVLSQEMLRHSSVSVSEGSLGPGAHKVCLSPLSVSGGKGI